MSTVQSYTAAHIDAITNPLIQTAVINSSGHLVITTRDGTVTDLGSTVSDADLVAIGALTPANDDLIQRKSGVWVNRNLTQVQLDMGFNAPSPVNNDFLQRKSGQWVNRSIAQVLADLATDPHTIQAACKTVLLSRTSNVLTDDPDLHFTVDPNSIYDFSMAIVYGGSAGHVFAFTTPAGCVGAHMDTFNLSGTGEITNGYGWGAQNTAGIVTSGIISSGFLQTGVNGGNFAYKWASATNGTASQLGVGSIMRIRKISP